MGIGPDQSLSCPHKAHSRSRDQPRHWRASWGGRGGLWLTAGARTLTAETPGKHHYYYYFYYVLIHSVVGSVFWGFFKFLFSCSPWGFF